MKLLFFGDSITDAGHRRERGIPNQTQYDYGCGYVREIAQILLQEDPYPYEIVNRGLSSNVLTDLYARIRPDVWDEKPDVLTVEIGVNEIWRYLEQEHKDVYVENFKSLYGLMIEQTEKVLPNVKIVLCEPYVLEGFATKSTLEMPDKFEKFLHVYDYAKAVRELAEEKGCFFLPLQEKFSAAYKTPKKLFYTDDGVHPHLLGAKMIASEWVKLFKERVLPSIK